MFVSAFVGAKQHEILDSRYNAISWLQIQSFRYPNRHAKVMYTLIYIYKGSARMANSFTCLLIFIYYAQMQGREQTCSEREM